MAPGRRKCPQVNATVRELGFIQRPDALRGSVLKTHRPSQSRSELHCTPSPPQLRPPPPGLHPQARLWSPSPPSWQWWWGPHTTGSLLTPLPQLSRALVPLCLEVSPQLTLRTRPSESSGNAGRRRRVQRMLGQGLQLLAGLACSSRTAVGTVPRALGNVFISF